MSRSWVQRRAMPGAALLLVVAGVLASAPAQGDPDGAPYNAWVVREDAVAPGSSTTYSAPGTGLQMSPYAGMFGQLGVSSDPAQGQALSATFTPPAGQTLQAGGTYRVDALQSDPTTAAGRLLVWRDGTLCGRTSAELFDGPIRTRSAIPATGTFHVTEIERDGLGRVTRFSATFELSCQFVGGQPGLEGSIAVNATAPAAPVPDAPLTPGPVTGLGAVNVGPNGGGDNKTTLSWTNPAGLGDVSIDMVQSSDHSQLPAVVGSGFYQLYRGAADRYVAKVIEFMDTRTYRVVPRGPTGRLGPATLLTVLGTRLSVPDPIDRVTIGQPVQFSGRLSESWDYVLPKDVMNGPALAGQVVLLCGQSVVNYVDGDCKPVDRARTTADGQFTLTATPRENTLYSVLVPATPQMVGNIGRVVNAEVAPQTDLAAAESVQVGARTSDARGRSRVIHFSTSRARAGSRGVVRLQRYDGHIWRTIATRKLAPGSKERRLAIPYRESKRGLHAYRVVKLGDAKHVNGYSRTVHVRVR